MSGRVQRLWPALVAAILLLPAAGPAEPFGTRIVVPAAPSAGPPPPPSAFQVRVADSEHELLAVSTAEPWEIVIAVDGPLSSPEGLIAAARLLSAQAQALTHLGSVQIVSVDNRVREVLPPTDSPSELMAALEELPGIVSSGEFIASRRETDPAAGRADRLDAGRRERQLLRWQRESLADWLLTGTIGAPKALFLIQDGFDFSAKSFYELDSEVLGGGPSIVFDDRLFGVALAATGWNVFPIRASTTPDLVDRTAVGTPLAEATGGQLVEDQETMASALDRLRGGLSLELAGGLQPGGPRPVEILLAGRVLTSPRWIAGTLNPGIAAARSRSFLAGGDAGEIPVSARVLYDGPDEESVVVEVAADTGADMSAQRSEWLSLALYLDQPDASPREVELPGRGDSLVGADRWIVQCALDLPDDAGELVAVVTDARSGRWGVTLVEEETEYLARRAPGLVIEQFDLRPPRPERQDAEVPDTVIRLLAPSGDALSGRQRFQTLVTSRMVARVVFLLDGEQVAEDTKAPFAARIDLGRRPTRHTVRADAYDALDRRLGGDSIRINEPMRSFDVSIVAAQPTANGGLLVETDVSHPTDVTIERVEIYYNESLVEALEAPPWRTELAATSAPRATDYVRAVAYLDDGRFLEDVRLLAGTGTGESVEVNLVQIYVVVTDREGRPVTDLTEEDFTVRLGGESRPIQRFAYADEVPLLLGLVIDTSPSMWTLMPDTKKAAARFLTQVLTELDKALVIDFDTRPRLAVPITDDITDLLLSLGSMVAEPQGTTALYDSVIFGSLQLPAGQDRKALVLLTDGDDYKSRFGAPRAIETAKRSGVPVYVVSLAGLHDARRQFRRTELDALTHQTGGEAYYLGAMEELGTTYDQITRELRSQYLLAVPTDHQLSEKELESLRVTVDRPGLELRSVIGGRSVN